MRAVAEMGCIEPEQLIAEKRKRGWPGMLRYALILAATDILEKSQAEIGRALGGRNHGTIAVVYKYAQARYAEDAEFRKVADQVALIASAMVGKSGRAMVAADIGLPS